MIRPLMLAVMLSLIPVWQTDAIQTGPVQICSTVSAILHKTFLTPGDEEIAVEIKLVTEDRRGRDLKLFARRKHDELCDVFVKLGWRKVEFPVPGEPAPNGEIALVMKTDFECRDKNEEVDTRQTDIILAVEDYWGNPEIIFFNYLYDNDEMWNKKVQRRKDDIIFFSKMAAWVEEIIRLKFNLR